LCCYYPYCVSYSYKLISLKQAGEAAAGEVAAPAVVADHPPEEVCSAKLKINSALEEGRLAQAPDPVPAPAVIQDNNTVVAALEAAVPLIQNSNGAAVTQEAGLAHSAVILALIPSNSMEVQEVMEVTQEVIPSNSMEILEVFLVHHQLTVLVDLYLLEPANLEQPSISQDMELTGTASLDQVVVTVLGLVLVAHLAIKSQDGDLMWPLVA